MIRKPTKTSPEKEVARANPGSLARDTGDKDEVHTSEEELGVTTPRPIARKRSVSDDTTPTSKPRTGRSAKQASDEQQLSSQDRSGSTLIF